MHALAGTQSWQQAPPVTPVEPGLETLHAAQSNITVFVRELKAMANSPVRPQPEHMVNLMNLMVLRVDQARLVADWMSSLGKLGFKAIYPKQRALIVRSVEQLCLTKRLSVIDVDMCFGGLMRTELRLSDLPAPLRSKLMDVVYYSAPDLDAKAMVVVLKALAKLGMTWASFSSSIERCLWQGLARNAGEMTASLAAVALHSLGQLGLDYHTLTDKQRQLILQMVTNCTAKESTGLSTSQICEQTSLTYLGMGKLGMAHTDLPTELQAHLDSNLLRDLDVLDARNVASVIYAFGLMRCQWTTVNPAVREALQNAAAEKFVALLPQDFSMALQGLASMETEWSQLMPALRSKAEHAVTAMIQSSEMQGRGAAQALANSIHSLGKMSARWASFPEALHVGTLDAFVSVQDMLNPQQLSNFIHGLGCMGMPFQDLSPSFLTVMQQTLHSLLELEDPFEPQHISNILLGFAFMGASWKQLPAKELERLLVRISANPDAQSIADSLYSLGEIGVTWQDLSSDCIRAMAFALDRAPTMSSQELASSMYGLTVMCMDCQAESCPVELEKEQLMWRMIRAVVKRFSSQDRDQIDHQNLSQYAVFFEWLAALPGGMKLITDDLGNRPAFTNPQVVHPTPLHLALSQALFKALQQLLPAGQFQIINKFDGLGGHVLDIDMAVHHDGKLIAFVDVDEHVRTAADGKQLKHMDRLKERFYAQRYPSVPLHHVPNQLLPTSTAEQVAAVLARRILHIKKPKVTLTSWLASRKRNS